MIKKNQYTEEIQRCAIMLAMLYAVRADGYGHKTILNVIQQLESRVNELKNIKPMDKQKIKTICDEFAVSSKGAVLHNDDWIVSADGDMIGRVNPHGCFNYLISADRLTNDDWCYHLGTTKDVGILPNFLDAYMVALCHKGITEVTQKLGYNEDSPTITIDPLSMVGNTIAINLLAERIAKKCI